MYYLQQAGDCRSYIGFNPYIKISALDFDALSKDLAGKINNREITNLDEFRFDKTFNELKDQYFQNDRFEKASALYFIQRLSFISAYLLTDERFWSTVRGELQKYSEGDEKLTPQEVLDIKDVFLPMLQDMKKQGNKIFNDYFTNYGDRLLGWINNFPQDKIKDPLGTRRLLATEELEQCQNLISQLVFQFNQFRKEYAKAQAPELFQFLASMPITVDNLPQFLNWLKDKFKDLNLNDPDNVELKNALMKALESVDNLLLKVTGSRDQYLAQNPGLADLLDKAFTEATFAINVPQEVKEKLYQSYNLARIFIAPAIPMPDTDTASSTMITDPIFLALPEETLTTFPISPIPPSVEPTPPPVTNLPAAAQLGARTRPPGYQSIRMPAIPTPEVLEANAAALIGFLNQQIAAAAPARKAIVAGNAVQPNYLRKYGKSQAYQAFLKELQKKGLLVNYKE
ncbi:MAG: hypothetical protein RLZ12_252 [Bacillota bacterium]|jgi:hypothetical protein